MYICRDCQEMFDEPDWDIVDVKYYPPDEFGNKDFSVEVEAVPKCPHCGTYDIEKYIEE